MNKNRQSMHSADSAHVKQRLLVLVDSSQIAAQLVSRTHQMACALDCWWGAVYVETSTFAAQDDPLKLSRVLSLARSLGAEVFTMTHPDLVRGLLRTAIETCATQIIIGKEVGKSCRNLILQDNKWMKRLLRERGELHIHVAGIKASPTAEPISNRHSLDWTESLKEIHCGLSPKVEKELTVHAK